MAPLRFTKSPNPDLPQEASQVQVSNALIITTPNYENRKKYVYKVKGLIKAPLKTLLFCGYVENAKVIKAPALNAPREYLVC